MKSPQEEVEEEQAWRPKTRHSPSFICASRRVVTCCVGVRMMGVGVVVVAAAALSGLAEGLYFHIGETERKCFNEELPAEAMVTGNYTLQLYDPHIDDFLPSSPGLGMHVEVRDPDDKVLLSQVFSSEGRFTFTSHTPGKHVICLYSNSTKWLSGSELLVHVDIQVGKHAVEYISTAKEETLQTKLELRVSHLLEQVEQITQELNNLRDREERFRQTYKSTYQQVVWWSVGQAAILLSVGFWQMRHLRSYRRIAGEIRHRMRSETRYPVGAGIGSQVFLDWVLENYSNDCGSPVEPVPPPKGSVPVNEN